MKKTIIQLLLLICCFNNYAQVRQRLKEVVVKADSHLLNKMLGQKKNVITTQQILQNPNNLTDVLRYQTAVAVKDYGNGGTSSIRFRGMSSENTAVLWNGINVNAIGSGSTDLNSLSVLAADELVVKSGGGGIQYGSGAMGGTIHINDELDFRDQTSGEIFNSLGSFTTLNSMLKFRTSSSKYSLKFSQVYQASENNYLLMNPIYKDSEGELLKNKNGAYQNYQLNLGAAYKSSEYSKVSFFTTVFKANRLLSGELPNPTAANDKIVNLNQRNLIVWDLSKDKIVSILKAAYLFQEYRYFSDKTLDKYSYGISKDVLLDYDFTAKLNSKTLFSSLVHYQNTKGFITDLRKDRTQKSIGFQFRTSPFRFWKVDAQLKKEVITAFDVDWIYALGSELMLTKNTIINANWSTNYRVPSFNDLYWPGLGNLNLVPESSKQLELGVKLIGSKIQMQTTFFNTQAIDKIVWTPNQSGVWMPFNLDASSHVGVESQLQFKYPINSKINFDFVGNFIYTSAKDINTLKKLFFVPSYLFNYTAKMGTKSTSLFLQQLYQSDVFTTMDNNPHYTLPSFHVFNIGLDKVFRVKYKVGVKVDNMFGQLYYYSSTLRPMPGRSYSMNFNYKF